MPEDTKANVEFREIKNLQPTKQNNALALNFKIKLEIRVDELFMGNRRSS